MSDLPFLSAEWLAALGELVVATSVAAEREPPASDGSSADGTTQAGGAVPRTLRLGQVVKGGPAGDVAYTVVVGAEGAGVLAGVEDADVTLVETYETARAMAAGELTTGDALAKGLLKVRGNANLLVGSAAPLARVAEAVGALRGRTSY